MDEQCACMSVCTCACVRTWVGLVGSPYFMLVNYSTHCCTYYILEFHLQLRPDPKPGRGGCIAKGSAEYANSLVCSACVAWDPPVGERRANELVFPPRQIDSCDAGQIFRGLISNFEDFAFNSSFNDFLQEVAKTYKYIFFSAVGDSASANCKGIAQFLAYIQQMSARHNIVCTGMFTPCFAHQFSRVLLLHLEQSSVSAALYSISRLHQSSAARKSASGAMRQLLQDRFRYHENTFPPEGPTTSPAFREHLTRLLTGIWDPDEVDDGTLGLVRRALRFFNGDLRDEKNWSHYCCGSRCHTSHQQALNEASGLQGCWR